jgi:hypothetical protein
VSKPNDQVFQLSLTEIAFTIVFLLLLLLGYLLFAEQEKGEKLQEHLKELEADRDTRIAAEQARETLKQALAAAGATPADDVITKLVEAEKARTEQVRLKAVIDDLNRRLTALTEIQQKVEGAIKGKQDEALRGEVVPALALQNAVKEELTKEPKGESMGDAARVKTALAISRALRTAMKQKLQEEISPGHEEEGVVRVVDRARQYLISASSGVSKETLTRDNTDLRGQVQFLKNRLDARGGRDYPPCWADEGGKVEYLFNIDLKADSVKVTPAWPVKREPDARSLPGIDAALSESYSYDHFRSATKGIFDWSKAHDPQCRHYVQLRSTISDAVQSDRARLMVEDYFYKVEARR